MAKIRINFSTESEVKQMLEELAKADSRSSSNWLTKIIIAEYKKMKLLEQGG